MTSRHRTLGSAISVLIVLVFCALAASLPRASAGTVVAWGDNTWGATAIPAGLNDAAAVAAGANFSLALKSNGTVTAWGNNYQGQTNVPAGLSNVVAISAGTYHSLALKSDGTVAAWGDNTSGQSSVPPGLSNVIAIATSGYSTYQSLALKKDGTVVGWGNPGPNGFPTGLSNLVAIAAGDAFGLGLRADGTVTAWGSNAFGRLDIPPGLDNVVAIEAGNFHCLALRSDGTLVGWGHPDYGSIIPTGLSNVVAIAAGGAYSLALKEDGMVAGWGYFSLADTTTAPPGLSNVVAIAGGNLHSLALENEGSPVILQRLRNQTAYIGMTTNLCVAAGGAQPLRYQWRFQGTNISGATRSKLTLSQVHPADAGDYSVVVTNAYGITISSNATLSVLATAPTILTQPLSQIALLGTNVALSVVAAGTESFDFQWQRNGTNLASGTESTLNLANVQLADSGVYAVVVSNSFGSLTSAPATLTVYAPVAITQPPTNQTVLVGAPARLMVAVQSLPPITYQWQFKGTNLPGATNSTLSFNAVQYTNAGIYRVIVQNPKSLATSPDAELTVIDGPPMVVTAPTNLGSYLGGTASFTISAAGTQPLRYQWRLNGTVIPLATNATLSLSPLTMGQEGNYTVVITNSPGATESAAARLTVAPVAAWGMTAYGQTIVSPTATNIATLVGGDNHCAALRRDGTVVTWGSNFQGQTDVPPDMTNVVALASGASHMLALKQDGSAWGWGAGAENGGLPQFTNVVAITAGHGYSMGLSTDSTVQTWHTPPPPGDSNLVTIAAAYDYSLGLRLDGSVVGWGNTSSAGPVPANATNVIALAPGQLHSLALRNDGTVVAWGNNSLGQASVPVGLSNVVAIAAGSFLSVALRANGTVVAWGISSVGSTNVPPYATNIVSIGAAGNVGMAAVGQGEPCILSRLREYTANSATTVILAGQAVGAWPLSYQWQFHGTNLPGATNVSLLLTNVQAAQAGDYALNVTNPLGTALQPIASLAIRPTAPEVVLQPQARIFPAGTNATLSIQARGAEPFSYQWKLNGTEIPDGTGASLMLPNVQLAQAGSYGVTVSNAIGSTNSQLVSVSVLDLPSLTVPAGTNATFAAALAGATPRSFRWQSNGVAVANATNSLFTLTNVQAAHAGIYIVTVTNTAGLTASKSANLTVLPAPPMITLQPLSRIVPSGTNVSFTVSASGSPIITYQWQFEGVNIPGATNATLSLTNVQPAHKGAYRAVASNLYGSTPSLDAGLDVISVSNIGQVLNATNLIWTASGNAPWFGQSSVTHDGIAAAQAGAILPGQKSILQTTVAGPATLAFWWKIGWFPDTLSLSVNGATKATLLLGEYGVWLRQVIYLGEGAQTLQWTYQTSIVAAQTGGWLDEVSITPGPTAALIVTGPANQIASAGANVLFSARTIGTPSLYYQWRFNGTDIAGATTASLSLTNVQNAAAGNYSVVVTNAYGMDISTNASLLIAPAGPTIVTQPVNRDMVPGGSTFFSVSAIGSEPLFYQWQREGINLSNATNSTLALHALQAGDAGNYRVIVTNQFGTVPSASAVLTLVPSLVVSWGENSFGQTNVPPGMTNATMIAAGNNFSLASTLPGNVLGWGQNTWGQSTPPAGITNFTAISGGSDHVIGLRADGTLLPWGRNSLGQTNIPAGLTNVMAVDAGFSHTLALKSDGTVVAWGQNILGETNVPPGLSNIVGIAAGGFHSLALKSDGTVVAWGNNQSGESLVPAGLSNVVAVAGGTYHTLALKDDGTVVGWGNSIIGETDVPPGLTNVAAIAAGTYFSLALKEDGTVVAWGINSIRQTTLPFDLHRVTAISAGASHGLALLNNGAPTLARSPWNLWVNKGADVTLRVAALGQPPLSYQWQFAGTNIVSATNSVLELHQVALADAGNYSVVVTNELGTVTSSPALLTVQVSPFILTSPALQRTNQSLILQVSGAEPGSTVVLYSSDNLTVWQPIFTNTGGALEFVVPFTTNAQPRFYRAEK